MKKKVLAISSLIVVGCIALYAVIQLGNKKQQNLENSSNIVPTITEIPTENITPTVTVGTSEVESIEPKEENEENEENEEDENALNISEDMKTIFKNKPIVSYTEPLHGEEYLVTIKDIQITKKIENISILDYPGYETDDQGNLIGDYSYVIIDMDILREKQLYDETLYLNTLMLFTFDEEGKTYNDLYELAGASDCDTSDRSCYKKELALDEKLSTKLVYLVKDDQILVNNMILEFSPHGISDDRDLNLFAVHLGNLVKGSDLDAISSK